jgi:glycerol-3-phosphate cytidylyltransferase
MVYSEIYNIGFTQGTFDLFHRGHLNLIEQAKNKCRKLIVGVNSDELVTQYKGVAPIYSADDRAMIVAALKFVDDVIITDTLDKLVTQERFKYDAIFIGDDWAGSPRWIETGEMLAQRGVALVFLRYTTGVSTSLLRKTISETG